MTTDQAAAPEQHFSLNPAEVTERVNTDVYFLKLSEYAPASADYVAKMDPGSKAPLQWHMVWLGGSFRFSSQEDPNAMPEIQRSINVTDKNGAPSVWGTRDPEPSDKDSFPIQLSKAFAKLGIVIDNDPHVVEGRAYVCEQRELKAGKASIKTLVPVAIAEWPYTGDIRIIQVQSGAAGNPSTGAVSNATPVVSDAVALEALAADMNGKAESELINTALASATVQQSPNVLSLVAVPGKGKEALAAYGTWDADGVFVAS